MVFKSQEMGRAWLRTRSEQASVRSIESGHSKVVRNKVALSLAQTSLWYRNKHTKEKGKEFLIQKQSSSSSSDCIVIGYEDS